MCKCVLVYMWLHGAIVPSSSVLYNIIFIVQIYYSQLIYNATNWCIGGFYFLLLGTLLLWTFLLSFRWEESWPLGRESSWLFHEDSTEPAPSSHLRLGTSGTQEREPCGSDRDSEEECIQVAIFSEPPPSTQSLDFIIAPDCPVLRCFLGSLAVWVYDWRKQIFWLIQGWG